MSKRLQFTILPLVQPDPDGKPIDIVKIREYCAAGLSECPPEDRALAWLVLLKVYPPIATCWAETKLQMLELYKILIKEFGVENWTDRIFPQNVKKEQFGLENNTIMGVIHGDIVRTGRHFFFLPPEDIPEGADPNNVQAPFTRHIRRIERMLYVFASMNQTMMYMQGFNELIIPLYFVMIQGGAIIDDDLLTIEAVTFHLFQNLISNTDLQEFYATHDQSNTIIAKLSIFEALMKRKLPNTYKKLTSLNVFPLLYAYRWFNLLFAQEHELPVLLIIWDALFAHVEDLAEYSFYVGIAHIKTVESQLEDNFPKAVGVLQNIVIPNAISVLVDANQMWASDAPLRKKRPI